VVLIEANVGCARDPRGAVLFDFGGTLDADGLRWSVRFHEAYAATGGRLDAESFESAFRASDRALEAVPGIRTMGFRVMIETQAELLRPLLPDGASMDAPAIAARFHAQAVRVVARNRPLLDALRPTFRLGVISNFTGNLELCLVELGIRYAFEIVTDSAILGVAKPDSRPFVHTIETLGVPPHSAWMVGDNFEADIRPGHRLGMQTVWLAPVDRPLPPGCVPTARIGSLSDLPDVVHPSPRPDRGASPCTA
jgi:FMN hydrolase / 5-amino-6-(5-phospho-D-ribitylamino)uracil phosphatase